MPLRTRRLTLSLNERVSSQRWQHFGPRRVAFISDLQLTLCQKIAASCLGVRAVHWTVLGDGNSWGWWELSYLSPCKALTPTPVSHHLTRSCSSCGTVTHRAVLFPWGTVLRAQGLAGLVPPSGAVIRWENSRSDREETKRHLCLTIIRRCNSLLRMNRVRA